MTMVLPSFEPGRLRGPYQSDIGAAGLGRAHQHGLLAGIADPARRGRQTVLGHPARGVRNTGEQAMLVGPAEACGAYIGFVGPA